MHEPKWDGFRLQIGKNGSDVRFYSRHGSEYTDRLPGMRKAYAELATRIGVAAWIVDLVTSALGSVAANGLASCLLIFGAHHRARRVEVVSMLLPAEPPTKRKKMTPGLSLKSAATGLLLSGYR